MSTPRRQVLYHEINGLRFPLAFPEKHIREALEYQLRPGDIVLSTFPKCGTTWTQTILFLMFRKGVPLNDHFMELYNYSPFLEMMGKKITDEMPRPNAIKVHLPYKHTPYHPEAKYIYVVRNPRDTCVSFFYHSKMPLHGLPDLTFEEYFEIFIHGENEFGDYFDHLLSWWEHRNDDNVMIITYEEMKADIRDVIKRFAKFIGPDTEKIIEDESVLENVVKYSSFEYMRNTINPDVKDFAKNMNQEDGHEWTKEFQRHLTELITSERLALQEPEEEVEFVRKGIVGDWKNHFTDEMKQRLDEKFKEKTEGVDISELTDIWKKYGCM